MRLVLLICVLMGAKTLELSQSDRPVDDKRRESKVVWIRAHNPYESTQKIGDFELPPITSFDPSNHEPFGPLYKNREIYKPIRYDNRIVGVPLKSSTLVVLVCVVDDVMFMTHGWIVKNS